MEQLEKLNELIEAHAKKEGIYMHSGCIVNFLDHIGNFGENCKECAAAMAAYTDNEVAKTKKDA